MAEGTQRGEGSLPPETFTPELLRLTEREQQIIVKVLQRDEELRRRHQLRVLRLKAELQALRRKGALRPDDWECGGRCCARCRSELGRVINRGAYCRVCRLLVCKSCREYGAAATDWVCCVCHKRMEIQAVTGDWMNEYVRRSTRRRDNRVYVPPADLVKRSIRRSWTISNAPPRWSAVRGSPELRPYSSLPRQHDYLYSRHDHCPPPQRSGSTSSGSVFLQPPGSPFASREHAVSAYRPPDARRQTSLPDQLEACPATPPPAHARRKQLSEDAASARPVPWQTLLARGRARSEDVSHGVLKPSGTSVVHISHEPSLPTSAEFSPSKRRHISFDVSLGDSGRSSPVPIFQHQRRSLVTGKDGSLSLTPSPTPSPQRITGILGQHSASSSPQQRRALFAQDHGPLALEQSGNSDSGGEVVATPPPSSRRFGPSPSPDPARASSGDDFDVEPLSGTVFRKVTVKKRRQETRRVIDDNDASLAEDSPSSSAAAKTQPLSPSPMVGCRTSLSGGSISSGDWAGGDDIDRLVAVHHSRNSSSSLGPRSDSMASVYSGAGEGRYGTVAVKGEVEFGLQYNYKAGALEILVKQCRDLAPVDAKRNRSDPYVKVYLLPDKSKSGKRKTKVKKHTLNPVFDEILKFHMSLNGLETRTLWLTVWHSDMFGRNDFLGEVMIGLENKVFDDPAPKWYPLQERTEPFEDLFSYKGEIIIGLKFVPPDVTVVKKGKRSRGSLHVLVKEAKNLTAVKANGTSDPFCKSYLLSDKGRSSKQKTPVVRKNCNPTWNHTFAYEDVSLQELSERSLELTVWDHDRLASNEFLGGLRFNMGTGKSYGKAVDWMDATGKEVTLWQRMLERPNFWVEGCLMLRPSLDLRSSS